MFIDDFIKLHVVLLDLFKLGLQLGLTMRKNLRD